jgi:L-lysine 2,3-aminomutase
VGIPDLKLATDESMRYCEYLRRSPEVSDVLITGGDPLVMRAEVLARYIEPLLEPEFDHIQTIRLGTKSLSYWPYRFLSDDDTGKLLGLLERIVASGKHLAVMAHFNHWREFQTDAAQTAIARLRAIGAVIRTQSPLIRHINDDPGVWARMWQEQVGLGCVPYYMFVERDTGAQHYFKVPLVRTAEIYRDAASQVSGLARTARGPVMSALPGKVVIQGVVELNGQKVLALSFLQARDATWCHRPFFAEYNSAAAWLNDLRPAFGEREFFYEQPLKMLFERQQKRPICLPESAVQPVPATSRRTANELATTAC